LPDIKRIFTKQNIKANESKDEKSLGNEYDECEDSSNQSSVLSNAKEDVAAALERIENIPCLPILPEEIFFYSYPEVVSCSNPSCFNSLSQFKIKETM
jgi:hypothetical protein